jgi:hypothetical protein
MDHPLLKLKEFFNKSLALEKLYSFDIETLDRFVQISGNRYAIIIYTDCQLQNFVIYTDNIINSSVDLENPTEANYFYFTDFEDVLNRLDILLVEKGLSVLSILAQTRQDNLSKWVNPVYAFFDKNFIKLFRNQMDAILLNIKGSLIISDGECSYLNN